MALVQATLEAGLLQVLTLALANPMTTPAELAAGWTEAYQTYAQTAQNVVGIPLSLGNTVGLQSALLTVFSAPHTDQASAAADLAAAFPIFWEGALFGATGFVSFPGSKSSLQAAFMAIFGANMANPSATPADVASQLSGALDAFTRTVLVGDAVLPIPPGTGTPPAPIF